MASDTRKTVEVGETHVTIMSGRNDANPTVAAILEKKFDKAGEVASVLLDSLVSDQWSRYYGWRATGCFVTELIKDDSQ